MIHGMEFQAIYNTRDEIKEILQDKNIKYTELKPKEPFLFKMLKKKVHKRDGSIQFGYGLCRWKMPLGNK